MAKELSGGVFRSDLQLADGRQISYYDSKEVTRTAADKRDDKAQPGIGHLRLDPLVNEWIAVASHRQHRVFSATKRVMPTLPNY
jgi:UDPglucose--hexose-1-phosphate uridylyltransferase